MLSADCVEAEDFYIGTKAHGTSGRGTEQQPMLAAVDRAPAGKGSCVIRCAEDCSGDSWRQFGHDHLCHTSRIRADAWSGIAAGLSSFRGLEQKVYDGSGGDDLSKWVKDKIDKVHFFDCAGDSKVVAEQQRVALYVMGAYTRQNVINDYLAPDVVDSWIVAYALAYGGTIVTQEQHRSKSKKCPWLTYATTLAFTM